MFCRTVRSSSLGNEVTYSRTAQPTRPEISNLAFGSWSVWQQMIRCECYSADMYFIIQMNFASHFLIFLLCLYDIQWCYNNVKCKTVHIQVMKIYRGSGGVAALILNLRTGWMQMVSPTTRPLYLCEEILGTYWIERYLLSRKLSGHQSQYACFGKQKNLFHVPVLEPKPSSP
jgi:hypothetical protein